MSSVLFKVITQLWLTVLSSASGELWLQYQSEEKVWFKMLIEAKVCSCPTFWLFKSSDSINCCHHDLKINWEISKFGPIHATSIQSPIMTQDSSISCMRFSICLDSWEAVFELRDSSWSVLLCSLQWCYPFWTLYSFFLKIKSIWGILHIGKIAVRSSMFHWIFALFTLLHISCQFILLRELKDNFDLVTLVLLLWSLWALQHCRTWAICDSWLQCLVWIVMLDANSGKGQNVMPCMCLMHNKVKKMQVFHS